MMKICFAIGTLQYSGAEKIMSNLIEHLYARGHELSIILLGSSNEVIGYNYLKQYPALTKGNTTKRIINRFLIINEVVRKNNFDLVVSFGSKYNIDMATALMFSKTPLILCERNDPFHDPKRKLLRMRRAMFYPFAKGFVFQTEEIKNFFSKSIQKRSFVITNFIEKKVSECCAEKERRKVIATSARLDDNQKNQKMLIHAFAEFSKVNDKYTLEFYGDGPDRKKYEVLIKSLGMTEKIKLMGRVDNPMEHIKTADIFVLPSRYEGMPNALIEAMSLGLPCIATDCGGGGSAALIKNGVNGILIPVKDRDKLVAAFHQLSLDSKLKVRLGKEAFRINETLEISKVIDMWESAFEQFASVSPG